jgi:hypothetical protein
LLESLTCVNGKILENYTDAFQDEKRNVFVSVTDKVLQVPDRMKTYVFLSDAFEKHYWDKLNVSIDKEEYVQPWVYIRAFHRLWDNVELVRNSLIYNKTKNQKYLQPVYSKEALVIGENEVVCSSVINRLSKQIWANVETLLIYFY